MLKGLHLSLRIGPIRAEPVPPDVIDALQSAQVTVSAGQRSGFQLVFALGKTSAITTRLLRSGYFDPPARVILSVIVNGTPTVVMDGVITRHEVAPSNDPAGSKLTITGEDLSRMMDLIDFSGFPYPAMPNEARIALMVAKYAVYGIVPLVVPSILFHIPNPLDDIPNQVGSDLEYITALANDVGYVFYIDPGPLPGMNVAYWGPEIKVGVPQAALVVNSDAETNVESMSFSFDGFEKTLHVVLIQEPFSKFPIPIPIPDFNPLSPPLGRKLPTYLRVSPVRGLASYSPIEAAMIGLAKAAKTADVISGSGTIDVLRYGRLLKARQLVEVRGAGITYDGLYFVKSVTHSIKPGEYKQSFGLARNAFLPFSQQGAA
jgi:hypothetical protein